MYEQFEMGKVKRLNCDGVFSTEVFMKLLNGLPSAVSIANINIHIALVLKLIRPMIMTSINTMATQELLRLLLLNIMAALLQHSSFTWDASEIALHSMT